MTDPERERSEISDVREVGWPSIPTSHRRPSVGLSSATIGAGTGARGGRLKPDAGEARVSAPAFVVAVDRAVGGGRRVAEERGSRRERGREVVIVVLVEREMEGGRERRCRQWIEQGSVVAAVGGGLALGGGTALRCSHVLALSTPEGGREGARLPPRPTGRPTLHWPLLRRSSPSPLFRPIHLPPIPVTHNFPCDTFLT